MKVTIERLTAETIDITRDDFRAYEKVRRSGVTNMFDLKTVQVLSGLSKMEIMAIQTHYNVLKAEFCGEEE